MSRINVMNKTDRYLAFELQLRGFPVIKMGNLLLLPNEYLSRLTRFIS